MLPITIGTTTTTKFGTNPHSGFAANRHWVFYYSSSTTFVCRSSKDLVNWSKDKLILEPELSWEKEEKPVVRNACVLKLPNGKFRLYYAAGYGFLKECEYSEPLYVSFAESEDIKGPYKKFAQPVISPNKKDVSSSLTH